MNPASPKNPDRPLDHTGNEAVHRQESPDSGQSDDVRKAMNTTAKPEGIPAPKIFKYPLRPPKVG